MCNKAGQTIQCKDCGRGPRSPTESFEYESADGEVIAVVCDSCLTRRIIDAPNLRSEVDKLRVLLRQAQYRLKKLLPRNIRYPDDNILMKAIKNALLPT